MGRNRLEETEYKRLALALGISASDVRKVVQSFFGCILGAARRLPFDDRRRIYTRDKFNEQVNVWNIPYIGRIGPAYSRYLCWRRNESKLFEQDRRSNYRTRITQSEIENMAEDILSGRTPAPVKKTKTTDMYNRVWLVGQDGKKLARQVIPKKDKNGIQD